MFGFSARDFVRIMTILGKFLLLVGGTLFVGAVAWWYLFYAQFLGEDVKQASECFYYRTDVCALGDVVSVVGNIPTYSPIPLWASVATIVVGLVLLGAAPRRG
jgi:hypothetical protein